MNNINLSISGSLIRNSIIFAFLVVGFFAVFRIPSAINIGFFISEDHLLYRTYNELNSETFVQTFENSVKRDMDINRRFRPLWVLYILSTVSVFGVDLLMFSFLSIFICIVTAFFLYKSCMNLGFNTFLSILFPFITLIGPATVMYIRRIDGEIQGMLLLSISIYFLTRVFSLSNSSKSWSKILFVLFLISSALIKESFLLVIPAILFLYIYLYSDRNSVNLLQSAKKNYLMATILMVYFLIHLLLLKSFVDIEKHNYAGVESDLFTPNTILDFTKTALSSGIFLLVIISIGLLLDHEYLWNKSDKQISARYRNRILGIIAFMLLFVVPQLFLYYRIGFENRYYLPYLMGYSFALIAFADIIFKSKEVSKVSKYIFSSLLVVLVVMQYTYDAYPSLTFQAKRCKALTGAADLVMKSPHEDLLIVLDPLMNLWDAYSLGLYMKYFDSEKDFRFDLINSNQTSKLLDDPKYREDISKKSFAFVDKNRFNIIDSLDKIPEINNILIIGNLNDRFVEENKKWFDENKFEKKKFESYIVYVKKD